MSTYNANVYYLSVIIFFLILIADPPRKDGGELLLSKTFLDACSSVYAVFPGGQENQEQPFISKHFNVIDPLRTNNNLGRSVSKGIIKSAHMMFIESCFCIVKHNFDIVVLYLGQGNIT